MKNQYLGDINDYKKYGLIRALVGNGADAFRVGVFWMLTDDDNRNDGQILDYLDQPKKWQSYDPPLFKKPHRIVHKGCQRTVSLVQSLDILPGPVFAPQLLPDDARSREKILLSAMDSFSEHEVVFFDSDNELEIQSKPLGCKNSNKYLYFSEVTKAFSRGHSLLIYQHFPRINRDLFIADRTRQLGKAAKTSTIFSFSTSYVCFFVVPQQEHVAYFSERLEVVRDRCGEQFVQWAYHVG